MPAAGGWRLGIAQPKGYLQIQVNVVGWSQRIFSLTIALGTEERV